MLTSKPVFDIYRKDEHGIERIVARVTDIQYYERCERFHQDKRRKLIRWIPEGHDTTRALIGWTLNYPLYFRCMLTRQRRGVWRRVYGAVWFRWKRPFHVHYDTWI